MIQPTALGDGLALFRDLPAPLHLDLIEATTYPSGLTIKHLPAALVTPRAVPAYAARSAHACSNTCSSASAGCAPLSP